MPFYINLAIVDNNRTYKINFKFRKALNKAQQKEINGGFGDDPFIGSGRRPGSCPTWLFEGIERPCGTSAGSFRSECISTPSGNECRIFSI